MLFFFAGYEIDIRRIAGLPLRLAVVGWLLSLVIAYGIGGLLAAAGIVLSLALHRLGAGHDRDRHADPRAVGHAASCARASAAICWRRARSVSSVRSCC